MTQERIIHLKKKLVMQIREIETLAVILFAKFDDWIINGIREENKNILDSVNHIKIKISKGKKCDIQYKQVDVSLFVACTNFYSTSPVDFPT